MYIHIYNDHHCHRNTEDDVLLLVLDLSFIFMCWLCCERFSSQDVKKRGTMVCLIFSAGSHAYLTVISVVESYDKNI